MPTETIVVVSGITLAFIVFAIALAWADHCTNKNQTPNPNS
ncbi:MAG: hypothetical protein Q8M24_20695 [Pseudolabrys sp.]|nr:hypothetical protein [Pseudolabrys sp.]MDP2297871.1 hypothetical protein [Pseudolabrys sp.]